MKGSLNYIIIGGLVIIVLLQSIMFASAGLQANKTQKQVMDLSMQIGRIQGSLDSTQKVITKISSFIDEPLPSDTTSNNLADPANLLSPENINKTLGI